MNFILFLLLSSCVFGFTLPSPQAVDKLDIAKYLGKWFQIYGAPTNIVFQGYGKCITAEYGLLSGGNDLRVSSSVGDTSAFLRNPPGLRPSGFSSNVSVLNAQLNAKNELEQIGGYAYYKNVSEPGKLTVHLDGTPTDAPYWVVALGEVKNDQYQYSIVTTPSGISLWVLARNVDLFMRNYDAEVRTFLEAGEYKYVTIEQDIVRCRTVESNF
jgi:lipocalin